MTPSVSPDVARSARRAAAASTIGTTIEWYDFLLYGTAAATVFPKLFFPEVSPAVGVLASFGTQFVGLRRATGRRGAVRALGRPHRAQDHADPDAVVDGFGHRPDRDPADLRQHRHRRPDPAHPAARVAGHRCRRRVGRLGAAVDGVDAQVRPRPVGQLAAAGYPVRAAAQYRRGEALHPRLRPRPVRQCRMAGAVPAGIRAGGHRPAGASDRRGKPAVRLGNAAAEPYARRRCCRCSAATRARSC